MLPRNHSPTQAKSIPTKPAATAKLSNPKKVSTSVMVLAPVYQPGRLRKRMEKQTTHASQNSGNTALTRFL